MLGVLCEHVHRPIERMGWIHGVVLRKSIDIVDDYGLKIVGLERRIVNMELWHIEFWSFLCNIHFRIILPANRRR